MVEQPRTETPQPRDVSIAAADGLPLAATTFERPGDGAAPAVVILAGAGVRRRYYARFAQFLATHGLRAVTFDYRGIGGSRPARLRGFAARMQDWARLDAVGVLRWVRAEWGDERPLLVGHSFGGQALGLLPPPLLARSAVLVAAQSGYWGHWRGLGRVGMFALWHLGVPLLCRVYGYFPGRRLGLREDLPADVAREWASWGRRPGYVFEADGGLWREGYRLVEMPILAYSFSDDGFAPRRAVDRLLAGFERASVERRHVAPRELGVRRLGHWGFFREDFRETLWAQALAWLRAHAGPASV